MVLKFVTAQYASLFWRFERSSFAEEPTQSADEVRRVPDGSCSGISSTYEQRK